MRNNLQENKKSKFGVVLIVLLISTITFSFFALKEPNDNSVTPGIMSEEREDENLKNKAIIAIIVADLGINKNALKKALTLPKEVTLGFTPYSNNVTDLINDFTVHGYETLINIPTQPTNYEINDPGSYALLEALSPIQNQDRISMVLSKSGSAIGAYLSPNEEVFANTDFGAQLLLNTLQERKLSLLYSDSSGGKPFLKLIKNSSNKFTIKVAGFDLVLDSLLDSDEIVYDLNKLKTIALVKGYAIGIMHPYLISMDTLSKWVANLDSNIIQIVPISKVLNRHKKTLQKEDKVEKE